MKPFFCYYGGKWRAAPKYPAPTYDTIVEPFAGAAGYSTRHFDRRVLLIEKDPVIVALWRYLISVSAAEVRSIPLLAHDQTVDDLHVPCQEAKSLVGFWLSKGSAQPKRSPSTWMKAGKHDTSFWGEAIRDRIASQVERIRHWQIVEGSYQEVDDADLESTEATWYVDPPYQRQGTYYRCSAKAIDFTHLGQWCRRLRGQVMVCEQEGADWLPFQPFITIKANESKHGKGTCSEVLWQNTATLSEAARGIEREAIREVEAIQ